MKYLIKNIKNYPDNGMHQQIEFDDFPSLPFYISKGLDGFEYEGKNGRFYRYNLGKITTKKWIVRLESWANDSLKNIFYIKVTNDVDKLVDFCLKFYKRSLIMELKKLNKLI